MISVGVKELKAKLSSYVEKARQGETIVVTDHGNEVALLIPISKERRAVKTLMEAGKAKWAGGKPVGVTGITLQGKPLAETVLEERR